MIPTPPIGRAVRQRPTVLQRHAVYWRRADRRRRADHRRRTGTALALTSVVGMLAAMAGAAGAGQNLETAAILVQVADEAGNGIESQEVHVVISNGEDVLEELTGTTEADGFLHFTEIAAGPHYTARAVTVFEGYPYQGDATALVPGVEAVLPLGVFTVGIEGANLHINVLHLIINVLEPGVYQAIQLIEILNVGEHASYTGEEFEGRRVGLVIPVPSAATGIAPVEQIGGLDAANLALDGNRLLDLRPVPPGTHQLVIQYELVTGTGGADIEISLPYPTALVTVLAGPGLDAVEIRSDQLNELPPAIDIPGGPFAHWGSDVLSAGDTLRFRLGPPRPALSVASWSLLGLAVALFASAVASIWRPRRSRDTGDRERLIADVAQLDRAHDSGDLGDAEYYARRGDAIGRLMQLQGDQPAEQSLSGA